MRRRKQAEPGGVVLAGVTPISLQRDMHPEFHPFWRQDIVHAIPLELQPVAETQLAPALDERRLEQLMLGHVRSIEL
jgi:hypothetical protein